MTDTHGHSELASGRRGRQRVDGSLAQYGPCLSAGNMLIDAFNIEVRAFDQSVVGLQGAFVPPWGRSGRSAVVRPMGERIGRCEAERGCQSIAGIDFIVVEPQLAGQ